MLEKSLQAQFLVPMAVAVAFGVLFSTVITLVLVLVPVGYVIIDDLHASLVRLFRRRFADDRVTGPESEG